MAVFWSNWAKRVREAVSRKDFNALKKVVDNNTEKVNTIESKYVKKDENNGNDSGIILGGGNEKKLIVSPVEGTLNGKIVSETGDIIINPKGHTWMSNKRVAGVAEPTQPNDATTKNYVDTAISNIPSTDLSGYVEKTSSQNTLVSAPIINLRSTTGDLELRVTNQQKSINCGGSRISGVGNPNGPDQATNKRYVDSGLNNKANASDVYLKSQTYTRAEIDNKDTTISNRFSSYYTKSESDARYTSGSNYYTKSASDGRYVSLSDTQTIRGKKTFYNGIDVDYTRITNVATPTSSSDAATKGYVDNRLEYRVHTTNGNITLQKDLGSGVWYYSIQLDSVPSELTNDVWLELIQIKHNNLFYLISPTQFVRSQKRYLFIAADNFGSSTRFQEVKLFYYSFNR